MMHIEIIAVGKLKERFWAEACDEYLKRLKAYAIVKVRELPDIDPPKAGGESKAVERESQSILETIPAGSTSILFDVKGKEISSEGIASQIEKIGLEGTSNICFIIGGSLGVTKELCHSVDMRWSLGAVTLPHNLARVVVLEQIYRAFRIIRREPYHK